MSASITWLDEAAAASRSQTLVCRPRAAGRIPRRRKPDRSITQTVKGIDYLYVRTRSARRAGTASSGGRDDPAVRREAEPSPGSQASGGIAERRETVRTLARPGRAGADDELWTRARCPCRRGPSSQEAVLVGTAAYQCYCADRRRGAARAARLDDAGRGSCNGFAGACRRRRRRRRLETILKRADKTFAPVPGRSIRRTFSSRLHGSASGFLVDSADAAAAAKRRQSDAARAAEGGAFRCSTWLAHRGAGAGSGAAWGGRAGAGAGAGRDTRSDKLIVAQKRRDVGAANGRRTWYAGQVADRGVASVRSVRSDRCGRGCPRAGAGRLAPTSASGR